MRNKKLILIEFNELCPHLLQRWMSEGRLPNFRKFYQDAQVFTTEADVTDSRYLEPWIQWYSLHTGLSHDQHGVFHLTDGPRAGHPDIWEMLAERGMTVGNFSSMNAGRLSSPGAFYVPDPWCTSERAFPDELDTYHKVVANRVQEYTNSDKGIGFRDYLSFARFLALHGVRGRTVSSVIRQLISERLGGDIAWRRAAVLDELQFDVFRFFHRRSRPDFATFFSNSTAHYQHTYWRHMDPAVFKVRPPESELTAYKDAILFGYQRMDRLLGDFFEFERQGVALALATALSQRPFLKYEDAGGQLFYRARDIEGFLERLDVRYEKIFPVMTHQYMLHFANDRSRDEALKVLDSVTYGGKCAFECRAEPKAIYFGCQIRELVPEKAKLGVGSFSGEEFGFYDVFYRISGMKSGCHHPDGVFWFKTGSHEVHDDKVSILDVVPTLLSYFDIVDGPGDGQPRKGRNLLQRFH
ncbi:MAG: hypothetical protein ACE5H8_06980 [Alphaproteobacteria bacterium]